MTEKQPLASAVLEAAKRGDFDAVDAVLDYYADDIDSLCMRTTRKKNGTIVHHIDEDMRNQIKHMFIADLQNGKLDNQFK